MTTPKPETCDRAHLVRLIGECAKALLDGKVPSPEAACFIGGALEGWLSLGGDLEADFLHVRARRGSHSTPASIWESLNDGCHRDEDNDS